MGCCGDLLSGLSRYILFLFNFIIFVCSIIFIVYGVLLLNDENAGLDDFDNLSVGQLAIALGVLIALVSFFGCCGAIKQNSCLLTTYAIILLTLFIIQVVLAILAFISIRNGDGQFEDKVKDFITKLFDKAKNDNDAEAIKVVDNMQQDWECCGVDSYTYWGLNIPDSCCSGDGICTVATVYQQGCAEAFRENLEYNITVIGAVAAVFAIIELVGAVFAFCVKTRK